MDYRGAATLCDDAFEAFARRFGLTREPNVESMAHFRLRVIDVLEMKPDWETLPQVMAARTGVFQFPDDPDRVRIEFEDGRVVEGPVVAVTGERNAQGGDYAEFRAMMPEGMPMTRIVGVVIVPEQKQSFPARWRKRPIDVEAVQWTGDNLDVIRRFVGGDLAWTARDEVGIRTLEGELRASKGDWIIRGVHGEFYPCKPDVFADTYEEPPDDEC